MNPRSPDLFDPMTNPPRRVPWGRWLLYAGGVLLVLVGGGYWWLRSYSTITVAKDTTYLTEPLAADGYPDYVAYLDAQNAAGVKPENNAWIPLLLGMETGELDQADRAKHCQRLGIPSQGLRPGAFVPFSSRAFHQQVPVELLIASSIVAHPPWYAEPIRMSAYNSVKSAERYLEQAALISEEEPAAPRPLKERILEFAQKFARDNAEITTEFAEDPEFAVARYGLMPVVEIEAAPETVPYDAEYVPDLRPTTLLAEQPAELTTPEEIAAWRLAQCEQARDKLFEREEKIIAQRPWSRAECPLAAAWLDQQSAALDRLLEELATRPQYYATYFSGQPETVYEILRPNVQMQRVLGESLQQRAFHAIQRGDYETVVRNFQAQLRLTRLSPANPMLIDTLVGLSLQQLALQTLSWIVVDPRITDEQLAALAKSLEQPNPLPSFRKSLAVERIATIDLIVAFAARHKFSEVNPDMNRQVIAFVVICWDDVLRWFNELFDQAEVAVKKKDWRALEQLGRDAETCPPELVTWSILPSSRTQIAKHVLARLLVSDMFQAYYRELLGEARHDAARVMVALERYRRVHQAYPAALAELVPAYLPAVPNDPFAAQPLKYVRTANGGYRAYSVGYNGLDDGGTVVLDGKDDVDVLAGDLVIGSPDEIPPRQNLAW